MRSKSEGFEGRSVETAGRVFSVIVPEWHPAASRSAESMSPLVIDLKVFNLEPFAKIV